MNTLLRFAQIKAERLRMRTHYRRAFGTDDGMIVLRDLVRFCGGKSDAFHSSSDRVTSYNLGKRRVLLRISAYLNMEVDDIDAMIRQERDEEETA